MWRQHDDAAPLGARLVEQVAAVDLENRIAHGVFIAQPHLAQFQHGGGGMREAVARQTRARLAVELREGLAQILARDPALAGIAQLHHTRQRARQPPELAGAEPGQSLPQTGHGVGLERSQALFHGLFEPLESLVHRHT